jgi:hypothetical protein
MTLQEAIKIVKHHQRWRRGATEDMAASALRLGIALDVVIEAAEKSLKP